jgi:hypothetical protein
MIFLKRLAGNRLQQAVIAAAALQPAVNYAIIG